MTHKEAFAEALTKHGTIGPDGNYDKKSTILGYSILIDGQLHYGYRGRTTWATRAAANREARQYIFRHYCQVCDRNRLEHKYWTVDDKVFNELYYNALAELDVQIVLTTLPKDV